MVEGRVGANNAINTAQTTMGIVPEYNFNREELVELLDKTLAKDPKGKIALSFTTFKRGTPPVVELYMAALSLREDGTINKDIRPIVACPNPPGWRIGDGLVFVSHDDLTSGPQFMAQASAVTQVVNQNLNIFNGRNQFSIQLNSEITTPQIGEPELISFVSFVAKDGAGNPIPNAAVRATL